MVRWRVEISPPLTTFLQAGLELLSAGSTVHTRVGGVEEESVTASSVEEDD